MHLTELTEKLRIAKINYLVMGGYAVNFHDFSRNTVDIDLVIKFTLANFKKIEAILSEMGLISNIPVDAVSVFKFREEYIQNRNLIAWNFFDPSSPTSQVNILITHDTSDFKSEKFRVGEYEVKAICKVDFIEMKRKSGRDKDLMDIRELAK